MNTLKELFLHLLVVVMMKKVLLVQLSFLKSLRNSKRCYAPILKHPQRVSSKEVKGAASLSLVSVPAGDRCRMDGYIFNNGVNFGEISNLFAASHGMYKVHRSKTHSEDDESGDEDSGRYIIHE